MLAELVLAATLAGSGESPITAFRVDDFARLPAGAVGTLIATTGETGTTPKATVTMPDGDAVERIPGGRYRVLVYDRHRGANFHLFAAGFDESTTGTFTGFQAWTTDMLGGWWRFRLLPARVSLPYDTVAEGASLGAPLAEPRLQIVDSASERARLAALVIPAQQGNVRRADLRRFVLVTALRPVPDLGRHIGITQIVRKREILVLRYEQRPIGTSLPAFGTAYHVVRISRAVLGRPLPRGVRTELVGILPPPPQG
jgi:hypothetical protein